jgi:hypothetical protein
MPPAGFKPTIPASERPQTHALDRATTGIGYYYYYYYVFTTVIFTLPCRTTVISNTASSTSLEPVALYFYNEICNIHTFYGQTLFHLIIRL